MRINLSLTRSLFPALAPVLIVGLVLSGTACRKAKKDPVKDGGMTATQILEDAQNLLKRGKWEDGRRMLRVIEEQLPSSAEFPKAKLLMGDSYFFQSSSSYPEALVEYQSFLNFFPRHEQRDLALYRVALCHYAAITNAERDQSETRMAIHAFQALLDEAPGSSYAVDARNKITQCWRRLAEYELIVGIQYVNSYHFAGAETRLKQLLETYPDYVDRERAYFYLGEAMRSKNMPYALITQYQTDYLDRKGYSDFSKLKKEELQEIKDTLKRMIDEEETKYRAEAKTYYQRLVESYPQGTWTGRAKDRLLEMGQSNVKEELDS